MLCINVNAKAFEKAQSVAVCKHRKLLWLFCLVVIVVVVTNNFPGTPAQNDMMPK